MLLVIRYHSGSLSQYSIAKIFSMVLLTVAHKIFENQ